MLTIFNRKELIITLDMKRMSDIRDILFANGIKHFVKTTNLQSSRVAGSQRGQIGSFGVDQNFSYEYKIYVYKNEYEKAARLIRKV